MPRFWQATKLPVRSWVANLGLYDRAVAEASGKRTSTVVQGTEAENELEEMLAAADPALESSLDLLSVSEEHYFAAVHQENTGLPTTVSSSAEA
jgi:hypothetical protein